jgi:hypothetical protein
MANFGQKSYSYDLAFSFLAFFAYFQVLISAANLNQNTTHYSIFESVECE